MRDKKTFHFVMCVILLILNSSVFAKIIDYKFDGTIDNITGGSGDILNINAFSGHLVYDTSTHWLSGGDGVANYNFYSFSAVLTGPGIALNYPDQL